jgi:hypothetical protein
VRDGDDAASTHRCRMVVGLVGRCGPAPPPCGGAPKADVHDNTAWRHPAEAPTLAAPLFFIFQKIFAECWP